MTDYQYRWYDAPNGRWPSRDPIGEKGEMNLYGFVKNEGVNYIDLLGTKILITPDPGVQSRIDKYRNSGIETYIRRANEAQQAMDAGVVFWTGVLTEVRASAYGRNNATAFWQVDNGKDYTVYVGDHETTSGVLAGVLRMRGEQAPLGFKYTYEVVRCKCEPGADGKILVVLKKEHMQGGALMAHELRHVADHLDNKLEGFSGDKTDDPQRWNNMAEYRAVEEENLYRSLLGINKPRLAYLESWFTEENTNFTKKYKVVEDCDGLRQGEGETVMPIR